MALMQRLQKIQPGTARMRISLTTTCGRPASSARNASSAVAKLLNSMFSAGQGFFQHPAYRAVVVYDPDRFHVHLYKFNSSITTRVLL